MDKVINWDSFYQWFKKYKQCDVHDGALAEGLEDVAAILLANNWQDLSSLVKIAKRDPDFRKFVLSYTAGGTADYNDIKKAKLNAKDSCPADAKDLCVEILKKIDELEQSGQ